MLNKINHSILNIGSGKIPVPISDHVNPKRRYNLVNIDRNYFSGYTPEQIESIFSNKDNKKENILNCKWEIFSFLERTVLNFDVIFIYRFFEHINRDKLLYFIYLLSTVTKKDAIIDLISPNYQILAHMLLNEKTDDPDFDKKDIILSTELFNEVNDPHLNITTPQRIKRLFEYEGRFEIINYKDPYEFDGRNIYFRSIIRRI